MDPLEIIDFLEKNVDHLEHDMDDPAGFWPHRCEECTEFKDGECLQGCIQYRDLKLVDYVALRMKESL